MNAWHIQFHPRPQKTAFSVSIKYRMVIRIFGSLAFCKIHISATKKEAWELLESLLFVCFANENQS
jgi:hypothetical protein